MPFWQKSMAINVNVKTNFITLVYSHENNLSTDFCGISHNVKSLRRFLLPDREMRSIPGQQKMCAEQGVGASEATDLALCSTKALLRRSVNCMLCGVWKTPAATRLYQVF
jgi:hypothetical protein